MLFTAFGYREYRSPERAFVRTLHSHGQYEDYFVYEARVVEAADRCDSEQSRRNMERSCVKALSNYGREYLAAWAVLYTRPAIHAESLTVLEELAAAGPKHEASLRPLIDRFRIRMPHSDADNLPNPAPNSHALFKAVINGAIDKEELLRRMGDSHFEKNDDEVVPMPRD